MTDVTLASEEWLTCETGEIDGSLWRWAKVAHHGQECRVLKSN